MTTNISTILNMSIININYKDYENYVKNLDIDLKNSLGNDLSACWVFAYYFHKKYNFPIMNDEPEYNEILDLTNLKLNSGIYSFYTENNSEFHHFILEITDDNMVNLFSTYGGQLGIIKIMHTKENFEKMLKKIYIDDKIHINDKISYYKLLYGIRTKINELDLSKYIFKYSYKNTI